MAAGEGELGVRGALAPRGALTPGLVASGPAESPKRGRCPTRAGHHIVALSLGSCLSGAARSPGTGHASRGLGPSHLGPAPRRRRRSLPCAAAHGEPGPWRHPVAPPARPGEAAGCAPPGPAPPVLRGAPFRPACHGQGNRARESDSALTGCPRRGRGGAAMVMRIFGRVLVLPEGLPSASLRGRAAVAALPRSRRRPGPGAAGACAGAASASPRDRRAASEGRSCSMPICLAVAPWLQGGGWWPGGAGGAGPPVAALCRTLTSCGVGTGPGRGQRCPS